jgi:hypothetical protein
MAQWSVQGAEKKTGRDATLLVEAPTSELARQVAKERGLLVAAVKPAHVALAADAPQRLSSSPSDIPTDIPTGIPVDDAPPPAAILEYLNRARPAKTPTLSALLWTSRVWFALALVAYAVAISTLALSAGLRTITTYNLAALLRDTLTTLVVGAVLHLVSTLLLVLRDRLAPTEPA